MWAGLGSSCLNYAAGSNASGANANLFVGASNHRLHAAEIGVPPAPRDIVCVADVIAETRLLAANLTSECHIRSNVIFRKQTNFYVSREATNRKANYASGLAARRLQGSPAWVGAAERFFRRRQPDQIYKRHGQ